MKRIPMWVARWVDGHLSFQAKMRFLSLWCWVSSPIKTLKYEWQMYEVRKREKQFRKFLHEQDLDIEDYP